MTCMLCEDGNSKARTERRGVGERPLYTWRRLQELYPQRQAFTQRASVAGSEENIEQRTEKSEE